MKTFKQILKEGMIPEAYLKDGQDAAVWLDSEIKKMFKAPRWTAEARMGKILGPVFIVRIIFFGEQTHNDLNSLNSNRQLRLMMQFSSSRGEVVEMDKFQLEWSGHTRLPKTVKYRKITAKSPMEVAKKLVKWLKKNESNFKEGTE